MKVIVKYLSLVLVSFMIGFILIKFVVSEFITHFLPTMVIYNWVGIGELILVSLFILFTLIQIINKRISKNFIYIMWSIYFILLGFGLFGRSHGYTGINLNPLDVFTGLKEFSYSRMILVMNILLFVPLGYLFRNKKTIFSVVSILIILLSIESFQYITKCGVFDIDDIILNFIGGSIGYIGANLFKGRKIIKVEKS